MGKLILPEVTKIVNAMTPQANGSAIAGDYVTLKDAARGYIVVEVAQVAATPVDLTVEQARDVSGTGAKAITNTVPIWTNLDVSASDSLVRQTDAISYTTDDGTKNKIVVFQIDARSLDTNNDFDCIQVNAGASDATNIVSAMYILTDIRYEQATPPSAIVD